MRIPHHSLERAQHFLDVRRCMSKPAAGRIAMQDNGGKRLVYFVRDRSREFPERRETRHARECRLCCAQGRFGLPLLSHINKGASVFNQYTVFIEYGMTNTADVPHTISS